jgi:hypothetical protein
MNHYWMCIVCGAALLGQAAFAGAAPIIDQDQSDALNTVATFGQPDLAQSFQQTNNNIAGAGIYVAPSDEPSPLATISVWDDLPNQPGAMMLASGSGTIVPGGFFDVFWAPVAVSPGVTYFLTFEAPGVLYDVKGRLADVYPNGHAYANAGYQSFPNFDFAFRTYYDPVPEPMAWSLLVAGLASLSTTRLVRRPKDAARSI